MLEIDGNIVALLGQASGMDLSRYDESFLQKSLQTRMTATRCGSAGEYAAQLQQRHDEASSFSDSLHIGYSGFFRNPLTFTVLEHIVLPKLIMQRTGSRRKELRIWSTACAAGQEAYSLAMLLEEQQHQQHSGDTQSFDYRLFATDQSEERINEAKRGSYSAASLHNLSLKRAGDWFSRQGEAYVIDPRLQERTHFSVFDIFNEQLSCPAGSIFGDFDMVLCANLLFYYKKKYQHQIIDKTAKCLVKGGFFITGETERDILLNIKHHEVFPQSGIFRIYKNQKKHP